MYKIPKDGDVILAIRNVLARYRVVDSQRKFKKLVEHELNQGNGEFHVSGPRIRMLAIASGVAHVEVHTREGVGMQQESFSTCPACGTKLKQSKNMTVFGDTVTLGYVCPRCTYWTGREQRVPARYVFSRKRR